MKAIIPVAGEGTRLRPHTHANPKVLIHVAGKPMIAHILDELKDIGINDIVFIVGYKGDMIKEYVESHYNFNTYFVEQIERKGLGHAVYLAKDYVGNDSSITILGDTLFRADIASVIKGDVSALGVKEVDNPKRFGIAETENDYIVRLVEKPEEPKTNLALVGIYFIKNSQFLFDCLDEIITRDIKTKGEYQLTDALQMMIDRGERMKPFLVEGWYDCGKKETLLSTNRSLLAILDDGKTDRETCIIIPPVFIHNKSRVERSIIGPYVSIAEGCVVMDSIIKDSILDENAYIESAMLIESIVGKNATVKGSFNQLNIGDSSELEIV